MSVTSDYLDLLEIVKAESGIGYKVTCHGCGRETPAPTAQAAMMSRTKHMKFHARMDSLSQLEQTAWKVRAGRHGR